MRLWLLGILTCPACASSSGQPVPSALPPAVRAALTAAHPGWRLVAKPPSPRPPGHGWRYDWLSVDLNTDQRPDYLVQLQRTSSEADRGFAWVHHAPTGDTLVVALVWGDPDPGAQWFRLFEDRAPGRASMVQLEGTSACALVEETADGPGLVCVSGGPA